MKKLALVAVCALILTGCATFSGSRGQYQTTEQVQISRAPADFYDQVVAIGEQLGYQHTGGNRAADIVTLADQPNFGETMIGRAYSVQLTLTLQSNRRNIDIHYVAVGSRNTAGARRSQERVEQLKAALSQRFN